MDGHMTGLTELSVMTVEVAVEQVAAPEQPADAPAQSELPGYDTPEQRAERVSEIDLKGLSGRERVTKMLSLFTDLSNRELSKLSGMAAATAKKHREALKMQVTSEGGQ